MHDFIFLMHNDTTAAIDASAWNAYFARLRAANAFEGGSAIGTGICVRKNGSAPPLTSQLGGYIRVSAKSLDEARTLLAGNPVFEAGGTIEIRELPRS